MKGKTGKFSALYAEKTALRKELDVLNDQSRAVKSAHYKAKDEFRAHMQVENARRQEEYKARIALEKTEKMRVVAERELEAASIPAFADELSVCNALTLCLSTYLPDYKPPVATPATAEKTSSTPGRAVDTTLPAGAVVIKKKSEREDEGSLIVGKKKKGSTQPGPKKVIPLTPAVKALKLDLEMIEQFAKLKIDIPVSSAEVPKTLEAIEAKKKFFLENQAAKTLEAQEKARLKIDEIQKKLDAGEEEPAVEVVAA